MMKTVTIIIIWALNAVAMLLPFVHYWIAVLAECMPLFQIVALALAMWASVAAIKKNKK